MASYPTRKNDLGHFPPHNTFKISTPSVTVTIAADMLPEMQPGTVGSSAPPGPGAVPPGADPRGQYGYTREAPQPPIYLTTSSIKEASSEKDSLGGKPEDTQP